MTMSTMLHGRQLPQERVALVFVNLVIIHLVQPELAVKQLLVFHQLVHGRLLQILAQVIFFLLFSNFSMLFYTFPLFLIFYYYLFS